MVKEVMAAPLVALVAQSLLPRLQGVARYPAPEEVAVRRPQRALEALVAMTAWPALAADHGHHLAWVAQATLLHVQHVLPLPQQGGTPLAEPRAQTRTPPALVEADGLAAAVARIARALHQAWVAAAARAG